MSLLVELSGVQAAQTQIDTVGNNIANVATSGFKGSTTNFSDVYAGSLVGAAGGNTTPGQGVNTTSLAQLFTEGTVNQTGDPLNVAINGNGFFQLQTSSGIAYGRNGNFQLDKNGYLVTDNGSQVMGFAPPVSGSSASGVVAPIKVPGGNISAVPTANLTVDVNLPSTDSPINTVTTPFSVSNAISYDRSTATSVYDSLGVSHTLTTYFTQVSGSGTPNQWQTHWQLSDSSGTAVASGAGPTLSFNTAGQLTSGSGTIAINNLPSGAANLNIAESSAGTSLSNLTFGVNSITNDGNGAGQFTGVAISSDGEITGQFSNGLTRTYGTLALADFANPQGLVPTSDNVWQASIASGNPVLNTPGSAGLGNVQSGALEGSNVDLSAQLVNLIAAQQAYQANVQGINVEQQNLQRLLTIQ
jgi:flagellar hook protein FlgE